MAGKSSIVKEFKEFIMRGNVLDMAIGVIIATAFGAITNSLISNIIMPLIGLLFGGIDLAKWDITLRAAVMDGDTVVKEAVVLGIGTFITTIINFILIALVVFAIVKAMNKVKDMKKKEEEAAPAEPPAPSNEEVLLTEIRDLLKKK
jgi:large conductance mechanosensitive channel